MSLTKITVCICVVCIVVTLCTMGILYVERHSTYVLAQLKAKNVPMMPVSHADYIYVVGREEVTVSGVTKEGKK